MILHICENVGHKLFKSFRGAIGEQLINLDEEVRLKISASNDQFATHSLPQINSVPLKSKPVSELLRIFFHNIVFHWASARAICLHFCEHSSFECQSHVCFTFQLLNMSLHLIFYLQMGRLLLYYIVHSLVVLWGYISCLHSYICLYICLYQWPLKQPWQVFQTQFRKIDCQFPTD